MSPVLEITNKVDTYDVWQWFRGPQDVQLNGDEVHLWRVWLDRNASLAEEFWPTLSADERQRAERFRFDRDRRHFVSARGVLRNILGRYLRKSPPAISFDHNRHNLILSKLQLGLGFCDRIAVAVWKRFTGRRRCLESRAEAWGE